jgi:hypothetical protein
MLRPLIVTLALGFSGLAFAAKTPPPSVDTGRAGFADQKAAVEHEILKGEQFAEISADDKAQVFAALERMDKVMAGHASAAELHEADKVKLLNDQELVNALLTKANKDSRIQCRREKRVGSHRTTSTCRTVAEWRRASDNSREDIEKRRSLGDILPGEKPFTMRGGAGGN